MINQAAITELRRSLSGELLTPADEGYERARRVFNAMIDTRPALVALCGGPDDVVSAVQFASEQGLPLSVRSGGHGVAGKAVVEGGLVLDLSRMKRCQVNTETQTVVAEPGLTLAEFDRETQAFGLATTLGIVSSTGIAGLTLGGGLGWLNGRFGLACDNLTSVEIVTADARRLTASATENDDLFWAVRGGGGNFGVVTSFEYRLHQVDRVTGGMVVFPLAGGREVLRAFDELAVQSPDELSTLGLLVTGPDGEPAVAVVVCHAGPADEADAAVAPLRTMDPVADQFQPMSYLQMQSLLDASFPTGMRHYWKASFLPRLTDEAVEVLIRFTRDKPSPTTGIGLQQLHGAAARVDPSATAFAHRRDQFDCIIISNWASPSADEENIRWTRALFDALQPFLESGVYVNNLGDEGPDRVRAAYGSNYDRLAELKAKYDPTNFFRLNQNITPRGR